MASKEIIEVRSSRPYVGTEYVEQPTVIKPTSLTKSPRAETYLKRYLLKEEQRNRVPNLKSLKGRAQIGRRGLLL